VTKKQHIVLQSASHDKTLKMLPKKHKKQDNDQGRDLTKTPSDSDTTLSITNITMICAVSA
jgi:hypothetical protein